MDSTPSYWILIWDGWGHGLTMINPRVWSEGVDPEGHPKNWFHCEEHEVEFWGETILPKHAIPNPEYARVIFA